MAIIKFLGLLAISMVSALPQQAASGRKSELGGKIVGGTATTIEKYPYAVSIWRTDNDYDPNFHFCDGSIASAYWVITAGHCTSGKEASALYIRAGNTQKDKGTRYDVAQIITHPKFFEHQDGSADYDAGLVKLKTPVVFSQTIKPVSLAAAGSTLNAGTVLSVIGWGSTQEMGSTVEVLREVSVPVVSIAECTADYGRTDINNATMVCAGYKKGGEDSCQGDSGGALVLESTLVGIVSWGYGCAEAGHPGVYSNAAYFRSWFKSEAGL